MVDIKALLKQGVEIASMATDLATKKAAEGMKVLVSGKGFNGFIAAAVLVITADGKVETSELDACTKNIRAYPMFAGYSEQEILAKLNASMIEVQAMAPAIANRHLLSIVRNSVTELGAKEVLVELMIEIGLADKHLDSTEANAIREIIGVLGLEVANFPRLANTGTYTAPAPNGPQATTAPSATQDYRKGFPQR